jgi:hypothetical protein
MTATLRAAEPPATALSANPPTANARPKPVPATTSCTACTWKTSRSA